MTNETGLWAHRLGLARTALKLVVPIACTATTAWLIKLAISRELATALATSVLGRAGLWGPLLFLVLLAVRPVLLLPGQAFAALAGVLWGGLQGTALSLLGSALAMVLVTTFGRRILRRPLERWAGKRAADLSRLAAQHDFLGAILLTLNPLLPTDVCMALSAGAGGRRSRLILGSVLGSAPGTLAIAYFGSAVTEDRPVLIASSLVGLAVSLLGGSLVARGVCRTLRQRSEAAAAGEPSSDPCGAAQSAAARQEHEGTPVDLPAKQALRGRCPLAARS